LQFRHSCGLNKDNNISLKLSRSKNLILRKSSKENYNKIKACQRLLQLLWKRTEISSYTHIRKDQVSTLKSDLRVSFKCQTFVFRKNKFTWFIYKVDLKDYFLTIKEIVAWKITHVIISVLFTLTECLHNAEITKTKVI
jgi:hypothetical protein